MVLKKELEAFWKTRAFVRSMELSAAGWDKKVHDIETTSGPQVVSYVHDYPSRWTWLCTAPASSFNELARTSHDDESYVDAARGGLLHVIALAAEGSPPEKVGGMDWEEQLGRLVALYAGTTRTWEQAGRFESGGHFGVIDYRRPGVPGGLLRPFALSTPGHVVDAGGLLNVIEQVITIDRANHPDWTAGLPRADRSD